MKHTDVYTAPVGTVLSQYVEYDKVGTMTYTKCGENLWVDQYGEHFANVIIADSVQASAGLGHPMAMREVDFRAVGRNLLGEISRLLYQRLSRFDPSEGFGPEHDPALIAPKLAADIMLLIRGESDPPTPA